MASFKDKMLKAQKELEEQYEESIATTDQNSGFSYGSIFDKDRIPEGIGFYKMDVRDHMIDIIPFFAGGQHPKAKKGKLAYHIDLWVHQRIGVENDHFVCQKATFAKPDPICTHIARTRPDKETFKAIASKRRCVHLVYDRLNEDEGLQILEVAHFTFQKHLDSLMRNPKRGGKPIQFAHPTMGKSIWFEVKKSGTFTTADGSKAESRENLGFRFVDRDEPVPDEIFDSVFSLDECIIMHPDPKKMEAALDLKPSKSDPDEEPEDEETEDEETEEEPEEEETEDEPEEEEEESFSEQLEEMNRKELKIFIKENELEVRVLKSMSDDDLREAILEQYEEETEEEEEEPEEEETEEEEETNEYEDDECPGGHEFGVDLEQYPECNNCVAWDACEKAMLANQKEEKSKPKTTKTGKKKPPILRKK